jgi:hypothetical protein
MNVQQDIESFLILTAFGIVITWILVWQWRSNKPACYRCGYRARRYRARFCGKCGDNLREQRRVLRVIQKQDRARARVDAMVQRDALRAQQGARRAEKPSLIGQVIRGYAKYRWERYKWSETYAEGVRKARERSRR